MVIYTLAEWLLLYKQLIMDNPMSAYMFCKFRKNAGDVILVNVDSIPRGYTTQDVVNLCNGNFIKI